MAEWVIIFAAAYLFMVVIALAIIYWLRIDMTKKRFFALNVILSLLFALILSKIFGMLYFNPRPFTVDGVASLVYHVPDNGFPSGHTTYTMVIALALLQASRKWGIVAVALAIGVAWGRIAAHVHSLPDILGGITIAVLAVTAATFASKWLLAKVKSSPKPTAPHDNY